MLFATKSLSQRAVKMLIKNTITRAIHLFKVQAKTIIGILCLILAVDFTKDAVFIASDWCRLGAQLSDLNIDQQRIALFGGAFVGVVIAALIISSFVLIRSGNKGATHTA